jgi:protein-tyrosine-phosphatase
MPEPLPRLLFVCVENSCRSQMAEGFAAARHRLDWDLPDPQKLDDAGFREVRDRIEQMVRELVANAANPANPTREQGR